MIIPARYTEVLDNLLRNEDANNAIVQAMSTYPLYQTDPNKVKQYGTSYRIPTREELNTKILNYYRYREIGQETFGSSGTISVDGSHQVYGFFPTTHKMTGTQMNSAVNPVIISSDIDYTLPNGTTIKYTLATWPSVSQTYNAVKVQKK